MRVSYRRDRLHGANRAWAIEPMIQADPIDANGRLVKLGDWVRVLQAPLSIIGMPGESLDAFSSAIGHTFQVHELTSDGNVCLELHQKLDSWDSIYVEAFCCEITRRSRSHSRYFNRYLAQVRDLDRQYGRLEWRIQP